MSPVEVVKSWSGSPLKIAIMVATTVSVIAGATLALLNALDVLEPWWYADRYYAKELIEASEKSTRQLVDEVEKGAIQRDKNSRYQILSVQVAIKEADRRVAQGQIDRLRVELEKLPPNSPDSLRALMTEQIRVYVDQIRLIDLELDDLRRRRMGP